MNIVPSKDRNLEMSTSGESGERGVGGGEEGVDEGDEALPLIPFKISGMLIISLPVTRC